MRNLKRALSLALASVMLLGMMVVGTSASYADVTSKQNKEAIEVAQAVGVMVGDDKGNFNPDAKVTRVEMAVVMSNLLNLKVSDFKAAKTEFTDVPAWAAPYVAACKADGIIAGYSATYFGANDTVTAAQAGLMVLKALGYFQFAADFGDSWQLATVKQASKIDLYDGIDASATTALTRNDVAQLVLNALEATMVEPDGNGGTTIEGNGFTISTGSTKYVDVVKKQADKWDAIDNDTDSDGKSIVQLGEDLFDGDLEKKATNTTDNYGRPSSKWTYKNDDIGTYANKADAVYTANVKAKDLYSDLGLSEKVETDNITVYVDGNDSNSIVKQEISKNNSEKYKGVRGGVMEAYYDDDAKTVTLCYIYNYVGVITDADAKKDGDKGIYVGVDGEEYFIKDATGYKDDDVVIATLGMDEDDAVVAEITGKPETVKGYASAISSDKDLTIAGTKYFMGAGFTQGDKDVVDGITAANFKADKDTSYIVYIDQYKNILAVVEDEDNSTDDVVYVYDVDVNTVLDGNKVKYAAVAKVVGMDGVVTEYTVSDTHAKNEDAKNDTDFTTAHGLVGKFGYLNYDKGDDKYTITAVDTDDYSVVNATVNANIKLDAKDTKAKLNGSDTVYLKNDTVYLFVELNDDGDDIDKVSVKVGGVDYTTVAGLYVADGKNVKYVVFVDSYTANTDKVVYLDNEKFNALTADDYKTFDAYKLGDKKTTEITVASVDGTSAKDLAADTKLNGFYKYSEKADGALKLTKVADSYTADKDSYFTTTITGVTDDNVEFTQDSALFTKNSVIVDLTDADKVAENAYERNVTTLSALDKVTDAKKADSDDAKYEVSAAIFVNEDGEVENIFITEIALAQ